MTVLPLHASTLPEFDYLVEESLPQGRIWLERGYTDPEGILQQSGALRTHYFSLLPQLYEARIGMVPTRYVMELRAGVWRQRVGESPYAITHTLATDRRVAYCVATSFSDGEDVARAFLQSLPGNR